MTLPDNLFDPLGILNSLKRAGDVLRERPPLFLLPHAISVALIHIIVLWLLRSAKLSPMIQLICHHILLFPAECCAIRATVEYYSSPETRPTLASCINHTLSRFGQLLGACLLIYLAIGIPVWIVEQIRGGAFFSNMVLWVLGAYITVLTYHAYPAILVEHLGITDSIGRSLDLTKENRVHIFLVLAIYVLVSWGVLYLVGLVPVAGRILQFLCAIVLAAFGSILKAVVYVDIRTKQEGYTQEILTQELGSHEASPYVTMGSGVV